MKNCEEILILIDRFADGELNETERAALDSHIKNCPECRDEFEAQLMISKILADSGNEELPETFECELHEKLRTVRPKSEKQYVKFFGSVHFKTIAGIAAGILIITFVIASGNFFRMGGMSSATVPNSSTQDNGKSEKGSNSNGVDINNADGDNKNQAAGDADIVFIETSVPQPSESPGAVWENGIKGATPAPTNRIWISEIITLNIKSNDYAGDYLKISSLATEYGADVERNNDASRLEMKILKSYYDDFLEKLKTSLGVEDVVESGIAAQGNDGTVDTAGPEYALVMMNLEQ